MRISLITQKTVPGGVINLSQNQIAIIIDDPGRIVDGSARLIAESSVEARELELFLTTPPPKVSHMLEIGRGRYCALAFTDRK